MSHLFTSNIRQLSLENTSMDTVNLKVWVCVLDHGCCFLFCACVSGYMSWQRRSIVVLMWHVTGNLFAFFKKYCYFWHCGKYPIKTTHRIDKKINVILFFFLIIPLIPIVFERSKSRYFFIRFCLKFKTKTWFTFAFIF